MARKSKAPALFYFWDHDDKEELDTPTFRDLVSRSDSVFRELVAPHLEGVNEMEIDFNNYIQKGIVSPKLEVVLADIGWEDEILFGLLKGTGKKLVLERTLEAPVNPNEWDTRCSDLFFNHGLGVALEETARYLKENEDYQVKRELDVAEQIKAVPGAVTVLFGAGHPELERLVSQKRKTEVHFPYEGYCVGAHTLMAQEFRKTGVVNPALFLRHQIESVVRKALCNKYGGEITTQEKEIAIDKYLGLMNPQQMESYGSHLKFYRDFGMGPIDVFESFLRKENLPSMEDVVGKKPVPKPEPSRIKIWTPSSGRIII